MKTKLILLLLFILAGTNLYAQKGFPFDNEIRAFKQRDSVAFPPTNGILFIGSSSIRKWTDLEQRFADEPIIRRGVGGCELWQLVDFYTPYILFPYHPRKIFVYAGDNDIAGGKSGEFVLQQFQKLLLLIKGQLPDAKVYFMSIKKCPSRARYYDEVTKANELVKNYITNKPGITYLDLNTVIQKENSNMPDSALFEPDYIHLNSKGYDRWQKVLSPYVK